MNDYIPRKRPIPAKIVERENAGRTEYVAMIQGSNHGVRHCREGAMHIIREWIKRDNAARRKAR